MFPKKHDNFWKFVNGHMANLGDLLLKKDDKLGICHGHMKKIRRFVLWKDRKFMNLPREPGKVSNFVIYKIGKFRILPCYRREIFHTSNIATGLGGIYIICQAQSKEFKHGKKTCVFKNIATGKNIEEFSKVGWIEISMG